MIDTDRYSEALASITCQTASRVIHQGPRTLALSTRSLPSNLATMQCPPNLHPSLLPACSEDRGLASVSHWYQWDPLYFNWVSPALRKNLIKNQKIWGLLLHHCLCCAVLSHSVVSNSFRPHRLQPARLLCPWGFSRQEHWSGLPCPPPGDLPNPGIEPRSSSLQADSLPAELPLYLCMLSLQSCLTLCDPMGCSLPGSSVHGILQVRILEWVAMPLSRGSSRSKDRTLVSCLLHWQAGSLPLVPPGPYL